MENSTATEALPKPKLLFVDDEQRVLNSMRIMFRRDFDLFLASAGDEALKIIQNQDIDVIVADHRMPRMTGVEVLTRVRILSPRTVRILLTGYADLDAVEGSINEGEVFRFLTKPCPPKELRETIRLAAVVAKTQVETELSGEFPISLDELEATGEHIVMESETVASTLPETGEQPELARVTAPESPSTNPESQGGDDTDVLEKPPMPPPQPRVPPPVIRETATGLGIVVFTTDDTVLDVVQQAVRARLPVHHASNIVVEMRQQMIELHSEIRSEGPLYELQPSKK